MGEVGILAVGVLGEIGDTGDAGRLPLPFARGVVAPDEVSEMAMLGLRRSTERKDDAMGFRLLPSSTVAARTGTDRLLGGVDGPAVGSEKARGGIVREDDDEGDGSPRSERSMVAATCATTGAAMEAAKGEGLRESGGGEGDVDILVTRRTVRFRCSNLLVMVLSTSWIFSLLAGLRRDTGRVCTRPFSALGASPVRSSRRWSTSIHSDSSSSTTGVGIGVAG